MRKTILRLDAVCLSLAGILGAMSALLSYTAGSGPLRDAFQGNPAVAGMVEAHALAILVACLLWYFSRQRRMTPGNWIGLFAHAILGAGNILWFGLFVRAQAETVGIAVTVLHLVFAALHLGLLIRREGRRAESLSFK